MQQKTAQLLFVPQEVDDDIKKTGQEQTVQWVFSKTNSAPGLDSCSRLLADFTLLQALLHTVGNIGGDQGPELVERGAVDGILTDGSQDDIVVEAEEGLHGLLDARVFAREASDELGILAGGVEFGM